MRARRFAVGKSTGGQVYCPDDTGDNFAEIEALDLPGLRGVCDPRRHGIPRLLADPRDDAMTGHVHASPDYPIHDAPQRCAIWLLTCDNEASPRDATNVTEGVVPTCHKATRMQHGRILKPGLNTSGYPIVSLNRDGRRRSAIIHHLVLETFVGARPPAQQGRHLNGDKLDARLTNLAWGTRAENADDMRHHGTHYLGSRTHCKRGHPFNDPGNARLSNGVRACRTCERTMKPRKGSRRYPLAPCDICGAPFASSYMDRHRRTHVRSV